MKPEDCEEFPDEDDELAREGFILGWNSALCGIPLEKNPYKPSGHDRDTTYDDEMHHYWGRGWEAAWEKAVESGWVDTPNGAKSFTIDRAAGTASITEFERVLTRPGEIDRLSVIGIKRIKIDTSVFKQP